MTVQEQFWNWFIEHEEKLIDFELDQERIFDLLAAELNKVNLDLTFEFGPKETKREFVISAGGIKDAFPAVVLLAAAAPTLRQWRVTAFRPRREPLIVRLGDKHVNPKDVQFSLLDNGKIAGLYLFIPGFREDNIAWKQIGYLLLDQALGEYDVETRLGVIKMLSPDTNTDEVRLPLDQLPAHFDQLTAQLSGHSTRPV